MVWDGHCDGDVRRSVLGRVSKYSVNWIRAADYTYRVRNGDSIALEGARNDLLELKRSAARGITVRDIVWCGVL